MWDLRLPHPALIDSYYVLNTINVCLQISRTAIGAGQAKTLAKSAKIGKDDAYKCDFLKGINRCS